MYVGETVLIVSNHFLQVVYSRIEYVPIQSEAVGRPLSVRRDSAAEPKQVDPFVSVIELQNAADLLNYLKVLVSGHVKVMQGLGTRRVAVAQCEVNRDVEVHSAAAENVLKERVFLVELNLLHDQHPLRLTSNRDSLFRRRLNDAESR